MSNASLLDARLQPQLDALRAQSLYRQRRAVDGAHGVRLRVDGRDCLNFCANDYLGLAADPRVAEAATRALSRLGTGSGAASLVSGYNAEHRALEEELADFMGRPRALLFSTGWAANLGVLQALAGRDDLIVSDKLNHASLIDGARLSGARWQRVAHRDLAAYRRALDAAEGRFALAVTDGVFSMDGDVADLAPLAALCGERGAALMVDDAHGFGVLGEQGRGSLELCGVEPDVHMATLGKSLGGSGAFISGSEALIEFLIQRARTWVFSTATPPAIAAAGREALRIVRAEPQRRRALQANIRRFVDGAAARGIGGPAPAGPLTPIQPVMVHDDARALRLSQLLLERGYWVAAIRPPTVPRGTARLRVTLSAAHEPAQIDGLLDALAESLAAVGAAA